MKSIEKFLVFLVSVFLLTACGPTVNCNSQNNYDKSTQEVIAEIAKKDPNAARDVSHFVKTSSFLHGGIDSEICGMDGDQLNSFVHNYVKDSYNDVKKHVKDSMDKAVNDVQKSLDEAFNN